MPDKEDDIQKAVLFSTKEKKFLENINYFISLSSDVPLSTEYLKIIENSIGYINEYLKITEDKNKKKEFKKKLTELENIINKNKEYTKEDSLEYLIAYA